MGEYSKQALYEEALQQKILTEDSITENLQKKEAEYKKSEDERLQKIKSAEKSLKLYNAELGKLKTKHAEQGSREGVIKDLIDSADHFIGKSLNIRSTLTKEIAAEVLEDAHQMLKHFNLCLDPNLSGSCEANKIKVYEHAVSLSKKVEKDKNDENKKLLATVLLVVGLVLLALGIIAAVAASHGVFLGLIPFATTKAVIETCGTAIGAISIVNTVAMKGCILAASFGVTAGTLLTTCGVSLFFDKERNMVKEKGRKFAVAAIKAAKGSKPISNDLPLEDLSKSKVEADNNSMAMRK